MNKTHVSQMHFALIRHGRDAYLQAMDNLEGKVSSRDLDMLYDYLFSEETPSIRQVSEGYSISPEGCRKVMLKTARIVEAQLKG